jgi:hypothetical protein
MESRIALSTVVTLSVLNEFLFLKFSWELFHGQDYQWYIRSDSASRAVLSNHANVTCAVFADSVARRPPVNSQPFWHIAGQKMNAMADAWNGGPWEAVAYLDADIVITASVMDFVFPLTSQVALTPHYFPGWEEDFAEKQQREAKEGYYNSGFVVARDRTFPEWWKHAYQRRPGKSFGDQRCLSEARDHFDVAALDQSANIGFWRTPFRSIPTFKAIPADCKFLHCHLFQPLRTQLEWLNRMFALHSLDFLRNSSVPAHRALSEEIVARDQSRWYRSSLVLRDSRNLWAQHRGSSEGSP